MSSKRSDNLPDLTLPAQSFVDYHLLLLFFSFSFGFSFFFSDFESNRTTIEGRKKGVMVQVEKWSLRFESK